MKLSVPNQLDSLPTTLYSFTTTNGTAGGTVLPVRNINPYSNQSAIQIGKTGEEQAEILVVSGVPSGTAVNTSGTLKFSHPIDTPVYNIHYDQIIFKRSTTGTAGTASAVATVSITPDSLYTEYNDTSGAVTYAYKTQYLNSVSSEISAESDWFTPAGPPFYSLIKLRNRVRSAMFNSAFINNDDIIDDWINEWVETMTNSAIKVNQGYSLGTVNVTLGTAGYGTITSNDFKSPVKMEFTNDSTNYVNSTEIPINRFSSSDIFSSTRPRHFWQGDTIFGILPISDGTVRLTYSKRTTILVDDTDELPVSLRAYTTGCIDYCLYRAYSNDQKDTEAQGSYAKFLNSQNNFISEVTPRDQTGVKYIGMVDGLSGMNDDITIANDWII